MILSIVMPAFNAAAHMSETLLCIAPILGNSAELIFVDDGSDDDTVQNFHELMHGIPLLNSQLIQQNHAGVSVARNRGLSVARGDYILFLDTDDWVSEDLLHELREAVHGEPADIVCWGWDTVASDGKVLRHYFDVHPVLPKAMTGVEALHRRTVDRSLRLWTASAAYRRAYIDINALEFTPGCATGEDLEFSYLALLHARRVVFLPAVLSRYRKRSSSVTASSSHARFESTLALRRVMAHLDADDRAEVQPIASHFRRSKTLVNYFHTLESCMSLSNSLSVRQLLEQIEEAFPSLNYDMRGMILSPDGSLPLEWRLFARSPEVWWTWVQIRRRTDRFLPLGLRSTGPVAEKKRAALFTR